MRTRPSFVYTSVSQLSSPCPTHSSWSWAVRTLRTAGTAQSPPSRQTCRLRLQLLRNGRHTVSASVSFSLHFPRARIYSLPIYLFNLALDTNLPLSSPLSFFPRATLFYSHLLSLVLSLPVLSLVPLLRGESL